MELQEVIDKAKQERDVFMREATKKAYDYACMLEIGTEREKAFDIYENLRNAGRVY